MLSATTDPNPSSADLRPAGLARALQPGVEPDDRLGVKGNPIAGSDRGRSPPTGKKANRQEDCGGAIKTRIATQDNLKKTVDTHNEARREPN